MKLVDEKNWSSFLLCIGSLLYTEEMQSMRAIKHHPGTSCYEHSVFVAYAVFRLARRLGLDYKAVARAGLLHDLYLYDSRDRSAYEGWQCFAHPKAALKNAGELVDDLSEKEKNSIIAHMWPLARYMPHYREAYVVNLADKLCATAEVLGYWRHSRVKQMALA